MAKKSGSLKRSKQRARAIAARMPKVILLPAVTTTTLVRKHHRHLVLALLVLLAVEFLGGAGLFVSRQPVSQVTIASIYTGRTLDKKQIATKIDQAEASYRLPVRYPDNTVHSFSLKDMGVTFDHSATLDAARRAQFTGSLLDQVEWWRTSYVPLELAIDQKAFDAFIKSRVAFTATPPQNASLHIENGVVKETPGTDGKNYDLPRSTETIKAALTKLNSQPLNLTSETITPKISQDNLIEPKKKLESMLAQKVSFTIENKATAVSRATIGSWIDLAPKPDAHTFDINVSKDKVLQYINLLTAPSIHPPKSRVVATTEDGGSTILVNGYDGVEIRGKESFAATVAAQLQQSKEVAITIPAIYTPHKTISAKAYPKWIEVDTTTKRMYAYQYDQQVKEFLVSAGAPATPTVTGEYAIYSKYRQQNMTGGNADGSSYYQPNVQYVNYFYHDYAIHGNYWRPRSYFGNVNSSHGCVGIVDADAAWIYSWAPIGTPVIVHK